MPPPPNGGPGRAGAPDQPRGAPDQARDRGPAREAEPGTPGGRPAPRGRPGPSGGGAGPRPAAHDGGPGHHGDGAGRAGDGGGGHEHHHRDGAPEEVTLPEDPARVVRVSRMIRALLDELRATAPDEAGRARIRAACEQALPELRSALAPEMAAEVDRLVAPFTGDRTPGRTELRIVHAQLAGWLSGVWDGVRIGDALRQAGDAAPAPEEPGQGMPPPW